MKVEATTALVTGAGSGIGRALAERLAGAGAQRLILLDIDEAGLAETAARCDVETQTFLADVTDADALSRLFDGFASSGVEPDFVFNNVGIPAGTPSWPDTPLTRIKAILDTNLLGLAYTIRLALPLMRRKGGAILNTGSTSGLRPYLSGAVYAASKAGVIMLTQSCKDLAASHGVRVNAICPGMVMTPFLQKTGLSGQVADWLTERVKSGVVLTAEQVADAAIALACDETAAGEYRVIEAAAAAAS